MRPPAEPPDADSPGVDAPGVDRPGDFVPLVPPEPSRPARRRSRWSAPPLQPASSTAVRGERAGSARGLLLVLGGLVAVGAVIAAIVGATLWAGRLELGLPHGRLAVAPFVDATATPELAWVERGMPELLVETLAETPEVPLVSRSGLRALQDERRLDPRREEDRLELRRLAFELGADLVLEGTLERPAQRDVRGQTLQVVVYGRRGEVARKALTREDPVELIADLAATVGRELGGGTEPLPLADAIAPSSFLARLYAMGVHELETRGCGVAAEYFDIVLRYRPDLFLPALRASQCDVSRSRVAKAEEARLKLVSDAEARGGRHRRAVAAAALAETARLQGRKEESAGLLEQAGRLYEELGDRADQASTLVSRAELAIEAKDWEAADASLRAALGLVRAIADVPAQVDVLFALVSVTQRRRLPEEAIALLEEARQTASRAGDAWLEAESAFRLAVVARRRGDLVRATELGRQAVAFFATHGDRRRQISSQRELGETLLAAGAVAEAEEPFQRVLELAKESGSVHNEAVASVGLARVLLSAGYPFQARTHLLRAIELDRHVPDRIELQVLIGWLAYDQGAFRVAAETLRAAKRQAGKRWSDDRQALLDVFEQAFAKGEKLPLPPMGHRPAATDDAAGDGDETPALQ